MKDNQFNEEKLMNERMFSKEHLSYFKYEKSLLRLEAILRLTINQTKKFENLFYHMIILGYGSDVSDNGNFDEINSFYEQMRFRYSTKKTNRIFHLKVKFIVQTKEFREIGKFPYYVRKHIEINGLKINLNKFKHFVKKIKENKSIPLSYIPKFRISKEEYREKYNYLVNRMNKLKEVK